MKKIFAIAFITLLFCASLFAEDFVVNKVKGTVKYESSKDVWTKLKEGDTVKTETSINVGLSSILELKAEDGKIFYIKGTRNGTVGSLTADGNKEKHNDDKNKLSVKSDQDPVFNESQADYWDKEYSKIISSLGLKSIKNLQSGKNVIRICTTSYDPYYYAIELTWTDSSASIIFVEKEENKSTIKKRADRKVDEKEVEKILNIIEKTDFYNQPRYIRQNGRDGETWYVETNINGIYKSLSRWDPRATFLNDLGNALYRLAR